jgi:replication-associated recombination protein RarA
MKIIHNKVPKMDIPKFNVDGQLDEKLNKYEITKLMNKSNFTLFLGKPGSGKSSLLISFLQSAELFKKVFHNIYLFMPHNSRSSVSNGFFENNIPEDNIYDDVTLENLQEVYEKIQTNALEGETSLILFDDVQKYFKGDNEKFLLHMANNRRHAKMSMWMACQTYKSIPTQIRMSITDMFIFKISKNEMENIFEEAIEQHKKDFINVTNFVFDKPHNFLYINTNTQRLFKNWDELLL